MYTIGFIIELKSDAEPGTGMGGDIINDRVPRNSKGHPIIPSTHLKGLIREELQKLEFLFNEAIPFLGGLTEDCLGKPGPMDVSGNGENGGKACFFITDAKTKSKVETSFVSRTALDEESGTAKKTSLRTTERIPVGTEFHGKVILDVALESRKGIAVQLALFSIAAIGGGRNRGCGQCVIRPEGQDFTAGKLGELFDDLCEGKNKENSSETLSWDEKNTEAVTLQLIFEAESPLCCPETPVQGSIIKSGFAIPASAVQGFIVTHIAKQLGDAAATQCFQSEHFRAWPLLPCAREMSDQQQYPVPTRVSLSHRVAKLISDGQKLNENEVTDLAIDEYDWKKADELNPLKASDGVLLCSQSENDISLWKSRSMPRIVSAHGVLNDPNTSDGRNLFQIESMAPLVWSGIVRVPRFAADVLLKEFVGDQSASKRTAFFGRSRSVRGMGTLTIRKMDDDNSMLPWNMHENDHLKLPVVIVQSPILLEDDVIQSGKSAMKSFEDFVKKSWLEIADSLSVYGCAAGIRFGWNGNSELLTGKRTGDGNRIKACQVIQPGAVIVFKNPVDPQKLAECIKRGLGEGREQGFGAVALHPGKANRMFDSKSKRYEPVRSVSNEKAAIEDALTIWGKHKKQLPSVSQIATVRNLLLGKNDPRKKAVEYLDNQKTGRTERIWATWKLCHPDVKGYIEKHDPEWAEKGLKMIIDLKISEVSNDREEN